jgi:ribosomal-protein-alanine N-acetyltransferase
LSAEPGAPQAQGDRVWVAPAGERDIAPYRRAVEASRGRLARWNPVDPDDLARALPLQSRSRRAFLIHAVHPEGEHDIVGKVNVSDVVRGRFQSAAVGYDAYDPYAGRGLFAEGLRLLLGLLFTPEDAGGMGLHRVQAGVQPGNVRSAGLLRSVGFQREGFSPRMLWLPGADGRDGWQDHSSYVLLADEWPAPPYPTSRGRKVVALLNAQPGSGSTTLGSQLARELRIPLFSRDAVGSSDALWALVSESAAGAVVQGCFTRQDAPYVGEGLARCGLDPATVPEICCFSTRSGTSPRPIGLGPTAAFDTSQDLGRADVVRIALQVGAGLPPGSQTS